MRHLLTLFVTLITLTLYAQCEDPFPQYTLLAGRIGGQIVYGGTSSTDDLRLRSTSGSGTNTSIITLGVGTAGSIIGLIVHGDGKVGMGTLLTSARLHVQSSTEQLRVGYDGSNYASTIIDSTGGVTLDAAGTNPKFTFADRINIPSYTPTSATDTGAAGDIAWDTNFFYVCTATNTWTRIAYNAW